MSEDDVALVVWGEMLLAFALILGTLPWVSIWPAIDWNALEAIGTSAAVLVSGAAAVATIRHATALSRAQASQAAELSRAQASTDAQLAREQVANAAELAREQFAQEESRRLAAEEDQRRRDDAQLLSVRAAAYGLLIVAAERLELNERSVGSASLSAERVKAAVKSVSDVQEMLMKFPLHLLGDAMAVRVFSGAIGGIEVETALQHLLSPSARTANPREAASRSLLAAAKGYRLRAKQLAGMFNLSFDNFDDEE